MASTMLDIFTLILLLNLGWVWSALVIDAPWGRISGTDGTSPGGRPYSAYLAIPYAVAPIGDLRFAKPVARQGPGVGRVFNASTTGNICPQIRFDSVDLMNEDCLTLSVYVPTAVTGPKSVMIWIHGGGFTSGDAASYIPSKLVTENDVIVVVIQYRLDVLGFLSSGDDVVSGNFGLLDQNMAIRWVRDNIQAFGGDPNSMTLFGESAGGASVGYQVLTPMSRDLNFKAILQSGTPLASWALNKDPSKAFYSLANRTGCVRSAGWSDSFYDMLSGNQKKAEHERIVACLRTQNLKVLMQDTPLSMENGDRKFSSPWVPCVDGEFLPRHPQHLLHDANYLSAIGATARDVMVGVNNEEGGYLADLAEDFNDTSSEEKLKDVKGYSVKLDEKFEQSMLIDELVNRYGEDLLKEPRRLDTLVNVLEFFYTKPYENGQVKVKGVVDTYSDISFTVPTVQFMRGLAAASEKIARGTPKGRLYLYLFNHYPASRASQEIKGTYHAEDILYAFDQLPLFPSDDFNADDFNLASTFRSMLTNFAKSGLPQLTLANPAEPVWPEFTIAEEKYLSLEVVPQVQAKLYNERVALWVDLVPSLVNSTQPESTSSWQWLWQQQQQQQAYWQYYNTNGRYNPFMSQAPMSITFSGRISFFKLP